MRHSHHLLSAALLPLLCVDALAHAQATQASVPPPAVQSDPAAKALLLQMAQTYGSARTYIATVIATGDDGISFPSRLSVAWGRPDRFAVTVMQKDATSRFVSDGEAVQVTSSRNPKRYLRTTADYLAHHSSSSGQSGFGAALIRTVHIPMFPDAAMLDDPRHPFVALASGADAPGCAVTFGPIDAVNETPIHTVVVSQAEPGTGYRHIMTFAISDADHLLYRVVDRSQFGAQQAMSYTLTYLHPRLNVPLPARQFALVPPPGAQRVDEAGKPAADPRARALVAHMQAAYQALQSFSCTADTRSQFGVKDEHGKPLRLGEGMRATYVLKKPGLAHFTRAIYYPSSDAIKTPRVGEQDEIVSDGEFAYVTTTRARAGCYLKLPVIRYGRPDLWSLSNYGGLGSPMDDLRWMPSTALGWNMMPADGDYDWQLGKPTQVNGEPVDAVVLRSHFVDQVGLPDRGGITTTLLISRHDHLLRQITEETRYGSGQGRTTTETYTDVQANPAPPDARFRYTPPPGSTAVSDTEALLPPRPSPPPSVGSVPPALTATDLSGQPLSLDSLKGKVVLLDFWATWCPPCREEVPVVAAAYAKLHGLGLEIIGICYDKPADMEKVKAYMAAHQMTWPQTLDADNRQGLLYGPQGIPFTILIGRDGKVAATDLRGPALEPAITAALARN